MVEVLAATSLALIVAVTAYNFVDSGNRSFVQESDLAAAQNTGRVALELFTDDLQAAGLSRLGAPFWAVPAGNQTRVRLVSDRDSDGLVGVAGESDENLTYEFAGPDPAGLWLLRRGVDLDGDGAFTGPGESVITVARNIVQVDHDRNGTLEPFLAYNVAPPATPSPYKPRVPATSRVTVTFGVRSAGRDLLTRQYDVVAFQAAVTLRNRL
jgi:hypothetical protein